MKKRKPSKINPKWGYFVLYLSIGSLIGTFILQFVIMTYLGTDVKLQTKPIPTKDIISGYSLDMDFEIEGVYPYLLTKRLKEKILTDKVKLTEPIRVYATIQENSLGTHSIISIREGRPKSGVYIKAILNPTLEEGKLKLSLPVSKHLIEEEVYEKINKKQKEVVFLVELSVFNGNLVYKGIEIKKEVK